MRLVASSTPGQVDSWQATHLIEERLVLTNSVCHELVDCGSEFASSRPRAALDFLRSWIGDHYPARVETMCSDGLDAMVVPDRSKRDMFDLQQGTVVCSDLAMLWTADMNSEWESDAARLRTSLAAWKQVRLEKNDL